MLGYCKTLSSEEISGDHCRWYGLDLVCLENGKYTVLASAPELTHSFSEICRVLHEVATDDVTMENFNNLVKLIKNSD